MRKRSQAIIAAMLALGMAVGMCGCEGQLPTPKAIEELDYEALFQEYLDDFTARDEEYDGLLESDPANIILEVMAYR